MKQIDNRDNQITSVIYEFDYDWFGDSGEFLNQREYVDAEMVNLGDVLGSHRYVIKAKGLLGANYTNKAPAFSFTIEGADCLAGARTNPAPTSGVDYDSLPRLIASMLIDRYRHPPLKFKANVRLNHWNLELGDQVQVTYAPKGLFVDREANTDTLTTRVFDIVQWNPRFGQGYIEATFMGHRLSTSPSTVVTVTV